VRGRAGGATTRKLLLMPLEAGTGWRYVAEEMRNAGVQPHLAEPAPHIAGPAPRSPRPRNDKINATCTSC
jgi:hypothetical protein